MSGPVVQSLQITFRVLLLGIALVAVGWCFSNVRQVPSDSQAAVLRFGRIVRVQPAGLLLAWPRPVEQVELLPAPARQMEVKVVAKAVEKEPEKAKHAQTIFRRQPLGPALHGTREVIDLGTGIVVVELAGDVVGDVEKRRPRHERTQQQHGEAAESQPRESFPEGGHGSVWGTFTSSARRRERCGSGG